MAEILAVLRTVFLAGAFVLAFGAAAFVAFFAGVFAPAFTAEAVRAEVVLVLVAALATVYSLIK
ncbi:hypothetical protein [Microvirga roseola]|uniref:hypothetical protein n=1 Tax=Microvirga roseola TaxID=2883126 RepID=UPI001E33238A|nr:hypothetical protein [Microvirga roseola]